MLTSMLVKEIQLYKEYAYRSRLERRSLSADGVAGKSTL